jgi:acetyl-CoA carboxylase biotin carboxyl carrier protein
LADEANNKPRPFDVRTVRYLVRLMGHYNLSEIDLQEGDQRIRIRRGGRVVAEASHPPVQPVAPPSEPAPKATVVPAPAASSGRKLHEIKASTVGIFYAQREPGAPPFVTVGSRVNPSTVVCLIEAMKVFNDITADCSGVVSEILVKDKEFVEYGTVLFRVDTTA